MTYTNQQRIIDSIPPGILKWALDAHCVGPKPDKKMVELRDHFNECSMRPLCAGVNQQRHSRLREQYCGVMKVIIRHLKKNIKDTRKATMLAIEWAWALHNADGIDIEKCGYGEQLKYLDDLFQEDLPEIMGRQQFEAFEKSMQKQMGKLHDVVVKMGYI